MIVVIADDFSGAAELAGISLRYGLKTTVCLGEVVAADTDVLVVCTDSRSLSKAGAIKITKAVVRDVVKMMPDLIFKKIDSVLRGHIMDELKVQMQLTGLNNVLILPANPSLGRIISNGNYFINGKKIHETGFAGDPEFPVRTSLVKHLVGDESVKVLKHSEQLPMTGFVVGEAEEERDTIAWANKINNRWILAGAADFYTALLNRKYKWQRQRNIQLAHPHLYVCGTAMEKSKQLVRRISEDSGCVAYINGHALEQEQDNMDKWLETAELILQRHHKAVISFDDHISAGHSASLMRSVMARHIRRLVERGMIKELFIEGGSTAATLLNELKIKRLLPVHEFQPGVVRMQYDELFITVKPGSYEIPDLVKSLYIS